MNIYERSEAFRVQEHALASRIGFYGARVWWIDTYTINQGNYYRFTTIGRNGMDADLPIYWRVPNIGKPYAFALRVVE